MNTMEKHNMNKPSVDKIRTVSICPNGKENQEAPKSEILDVNIQQLPCHPLPLKSTQFLQVPGKI